MKLLTLILCLFCSVAQAQMDNKTVYCKQFEITAIEGEHLSTFSEPVCYSSILTMKIKGDQMTVSTDSIHFRFVIIYHSEPTVDKGTHREEYIACIIGQPDKVYSIHKFIDKVGNFYVGCMPIEFNSRSGSIDGTALEVSNKQIFCRDE